MDRIVREKIARVYVYTSCIIGIASTIINA